MKNEKKRRLIYWLTFKRSPLHEDRVKILEHQGYDVEFISSMDELGEALQRRRVGVIFLECDFAGRLGEGVIHDLIQTPDLQGVCFLLSFIDPNYRIMAAAACSAFRDLIPLNLENEEWLARFKFSTSRVVKQFPIPSEFLHTKMNANLLVPARLVWLNQHKIVIESRLKPKRGDELHLTGSLALALGLREVVVKVESTTRQSLRYRFSDAIVCSWLHQNDRIKDLMGRLDGAPAPRRVFLAAASPQIRKQIRSALDPLHFDLNIALSPASIVQEPMYFCPECIILDAGILNKHGYSLIAEIQKNVHPDTRFVLISSGFESKKPKYGFEFAQVPLDFRSQMTTHILPKTPIFPHWSRENSVYIHPHDRLSQVDVAIPTVISGLHPNYVSIESPITILPFSLCRLDSDRIIDVLKGSRYIKITPSKSLGGYICDRQPNQYKQVCMSIVDFAKSSFMGAQADPVIDVPIGNIPDVSKVERRIDSAPMARILQNIGAKNFGKLLGFVLLSIGVISILLYLAGKLEPEYKKNGHVFTKSLKRVYEKARE